MRFSIAAKTDVGIVKKTNQDGLSVKVFDTMQGEIVFAVLCDGMGGLSKGEVASTTLVSAFNEWAENRLPLICNSPIEDSVIRTQWEEIVLKQNESIKKYGLRQGIRLGTTLVAMLITGERYYVMNIGDSRAYEISDNLYQITKDQTFVAREIEQGRMTPEQAKVDSRRNVLLQCVGASDYIYPDMFFGKTKRNAVYMLCSDGFRHEISPSEIYEKFCFSALKDNSAMNVNASSLIELNKSRQERDNISVLLIKTE